MKTKNLYDQLCDFTSQIVKDALTRTCRMCDAVPGIRCTNMPINGYPLADRIVHYDRTAP